MLPNTWFLRRSSNVACSLPDAEPADLRAVHVGHRHLPLPARHQAQHADHGLDTAGLGPALTEGQGVGHHCKFTS